MKKHVLTALLAVGALLSPAGRAVGQVLTTNYWFELHDGELLLKSVADSRSVSKSLSLPNGTYLDSQKKVATLADGTRVELHEGDVVSLNGDVTLAKKPTPLPAPVVAAAPALALAPVAPAQPAAAFAYAPPVPVGGKLKGVVELGASGFNSFIVRIDPKRNWKLEKAEFGASLVMENMTNETEIRQVLKAYISKMLDFGVGGQDIHFVVSSGAMKAAIIPRIISSLRQLGYVVNTVTPEREGAFALRAALPPAYAARAFVVDMGSANTKVSWLAAGQPVVREAYGAKYYERNITDAAAAADLQAKAQQVPAALRPTCFIVGGAPYEMAKKLRQHAERYVVLGAPGSYQFESAKGKAGVALYQAVAEATDCKQFVFDFDSNFTIGYLLSLPVAGE